MLVLLYILHLVGRHLQAVFNDLIKVSGLLVLPSVSFIRYLLNAEKQLANVVQLDVGKYKVIPAPDIENELSTNHAHAKYHKSKKILAKVLKCKT